MRMKVQCHVFLDKNTQKQIVYKKSKVWKTLFQKNKTKPVYRIVVKGIGNSLHVPQQTLNKEKSQKLTEHLMTSFFIKNDCFC